MISGKTKSLLVQTSYTSKPLLKNTYRKTNIFYSQLTFDRFNSDICIIFIIVAKEYKCPECGEEVELDKFNEHVKNQHKGHLDIK